MRGGPVEDAGRRLVDAPARHYDRRVVAPSHSTNPNAARFIAAMNQRFYAIGMAVRETPEGTLLHYPHLVSFPELPPDEQRAHVDSLVRGAVDDSGVAGATYTLRDTAGREGGNPNWWQFDVQVRVPRPAPG